MTRSLHSRRQALRLLGLATVAAVVSGGVTACGRKRRPTHPEGTDYPRTYPSKKGTN